MDLYMFILFPENIWDGFKEFYVKKPKKKKGLGNQTTTLTEHSW